MTEKCRYIRVGKEQARWEKSAVEEGLDVDRGRWILEFVKRISDKNSAAAIMIRSSSSNLSESEIKEGARYQSPKQKSFCFLRM